MAKGEAGVSPCFFWRLFIAERKQDTAGLMFSLAAVPVSATSNSPSDRFGFTVLRPPARSLLEILPADGGRKAVGVHALEGGLGFSIGRQRA